MLNFGGFLNSTFWSTYRTQGSSSIEDLLNSDECTVEKLLEDDDVLSEFKSMNDKLIQYFDHERLSRLVEYMTVMPPEDAPHSRGHKYPFIASEIFNCEINQVLEKFFEAPPKKEVEEAPENEGEEEIQKSEDKEEGEEEAEDNKENLENDFEKSLAKEVPEQMEEEEEKVEMAEQEKQEDNAEPEEEEKKEIEEKEANEPEAATPEEKEEKAEEKPEEEKTEEVLEQPKEDKPEETQEEKAEEKVEEKVEEKAETEVEKLEEEEVTKVTTEEPEPEEENDEPVNRFQLLDQMFEFIKTEETPLNPVLSGYFQKLVALLIQRKQKDLIPYVFDEQCDFIDWLLFHSYQKSISELLNKFLTIENDFDTDLKEKIVAKQE